MSMSDPRENGYSGPCEDGGDGFESQEDRLRRLWDEAKRNYDWRHSMEGLKRLSDLGTRLLEFGNYIEARYYMEEYQRRTKDNGLVYI